MYICIYQCSILYNVYMIIQTQYIVYYIEYNDYIL